MHRQGTWDRGVHLAGWMALLCITAPVRAQIPTHGYPVQLELSVPIRSGEVVVGAGAPLVDGAWVELWFRPLSSARSVSLGSVPVDRGGRYRFDGAGQIEGDFVHVSLSRSWLFGSPGDSEGWIAGTDAEVRVEDGVLFLTVRDTDGDGFVKPMLRLDASVPTELYRVLEVRLRNPHGLNPAPFSILWGSGGEGSDPTSEHPAEMPGSTDAFSTLLFPLDRDELSLEPGATEELLDGRWTDEASIDVLALSPFRGLAASNLPPEGVTVEIDSIRLREDLRLDFDFDQGALDLVNDIDELLLEDGFLSYSVADKGNRVSPGSDRNVEPFLIYTHAGGSIDPEHFSTLALGYDDVVFQEGTKDAATGVPLWPVSLLFDDRDSSVYLDDEGAAGARLQFATGLAPIEGRVDVYGVLDELTRDALTGESLPREWSEDGAVSLEGLRWMLPDRGSVGDRIRLDYLSILPANAYGPSDSVPVGPAAPFRFLRGDCNGDGVADDIADPIFLAVFNFSGGRTPDCLAACDANADGEVSGSVTDIIYLLQFLFAGSSAPPAPFPGCGGPRPSDEALGCTESPCP